MMPRRHIDADFRCSIDYSLMILLFSIRHTPDITSHYDTPPFTRRHFDVAAFAFDIAPPAVAADAISLLRLMIAIRF